VVETVLVSLIVGAAALWVVWALLLPASVKGRLRARCGGKGGCDRCGG
jgi:hypothetical protein